MSTAPTNQQLGIKKNKLLRYKLVLELYHQHKTDDIPTTVVWRKYIYPKYAISRTTLYAILGTRVVKELRDIKEIEDAQMALF